MKSICIIFLKRRKGLNLGIHEYEKYLHLRLKCNIFRKIERQVKTKMSERSDYQAYYYRPVLAKYHRLSKEAADYLESIRGD